MVTDWGDFGHLQPDAVRLPALALGAGLAWSAASNADVDLGTVADVATMALGDVYLATEAQIPNCSRFVRHLYFPQARVGKLTFDECDDAEARLESGVALLGDRADDHTSGLRLAAELVHVAIDDTRGRLRGDGRLASIDPATRTALADRLDPLIERHRDMWLRTNRPGGLDDSVRWLAKVRDGYRSGVVDDAWPYPTVDVATASPR